ncbi:MAG: hypothetical protein ABIE75_02990 [Candidatus Omnitrophota bacterium]
MNNTFNKHEEIILPSLEEWRRLYEAALALKAIAPWDWMWDSDMFAVQNPVDGEFGYCCVLGANREVFGFAVYLGSEGLRGYLGLISGDIGPRDHDLLHTKRCLLASFEDRKYLPKDGLAVIKQLGLEFSGSKAWPQFQSYQPGYLPWQLTRDEAVYLTLCLAQAKEVALRFKDSPGMLEPSSAEHYFSRLARKKRDILKWKDGWHQPTFLRKMVLMRQSIDENRLEKIKQLDRQKNDMGTGFYL